MTLSIELLLPPEAFPLWRSADAAEPTPHFAASPVWNAAWLEAYGETVDASVAVGRDESGRAAAFLLVVQSRNRSAGPVPLRTLHFGTTGDPHADGVFAEYVTPFVSAGVDPAAFWRAVVEETASLPADRTDFDGVAASLLASVADVADVADAERRRSPFHETTHADPDAVLPAVKPSVRKNLKRRLKQYEGLRVEWTSEPAAAARVLDDLIPLHQARWQAAGKPGAFASARFETFVRTLLASGDGRFVAARTSDAAGPVGCHVLLANAGRVCDFTAGFAPPSERPSPGLVSHYLNITEAARRGLAGYEFLVGESRVKTDLATGEETLCWGRLHRPTARTRLTRAARSLVRSVRRAAT